MSQRILFMLCIVGLLLPLATPIFAQQANGEKVKERIIYIPYQELEKLTYGENMGIYLPYKDYKNLLDELKNYKKRPPQLPAQVVISNVVYRGKVIDEFLEIQANYTLNILKKGWHGIELGFRDVAIKEATLDGQSALLKLKNNSYELVFKSDGAKKSTLQIVFVVPIVRRHALHAAVSFHVPRSPIANFILDIPHNQKQKQTPRIKVEVNPSLLTRINVMPQKIRVQALLGNTNKIQINWRRQAERKVEIKTIIHAENLSRLNVGENFLHLQSKIVYDVIQGHSKQLKLKIPEGFRVFAVRTVEGVGIRDWNLEQNETLLVVNLHEKLIDRGEGKTDLALEIKLERIIKKMENKFALPTIAVYGIEREKGFYTIGVNDLHTLKILKRKDINQMDINDLPAYVSKQNIQFAFKYLKRPFVLNLELERKKPEYEVITNVSAYLDDTLYKLHAYIRYDIKKSRIFGSKIEIPTGFIVLDIHAYDFALHGRKERLLDRIKEYREVDEQGKHFIVITFKKGIRSPRLVLRMHLQKKFKEQKVRNILLPVFRVVGAKRESGNIGIGAKSSYNITTVEKSQKNIFPLDTRELFQQGERPPVKKINIGMRYFDHPITAKFKIEKRDPLVTAEVYDYVSIAENVLKHKFHIFYTVKYTGVKEFSFSLPQHIAKNIPKSRISDKVRLIKEIKQTVQKQQKSVLYTVSTQRDVLGLYEIQVAYEEKLGQIETAKQIELFELITHNTKREHGFLVFKKNNNMDLAFLKYKGLETTDINDPNFSRGNKQGVLAVFKYTTHGYELLMNLRKLSFEPVLNTVINRLHITSTVNKDYTTSNEAVVLLINNRKQMLEFEVPEASRITSVARLKSLPSIRYRRPKAIEINKHLESLTWSKSDAPRRFKVNIATNVQKNAPFVLVIKYENTLKKGEMGYSGNFLMKSINFIDVPVTHFTWDLGLASEYQYVWFHSNMVRHFLYDHGLWRVLYPLVASQSIDTSEIKQDAETGVIPIYPLEGGKKFSFSRLNGHGYIKVSYLHNDWLYALHFLTFIFVCLLVVMLPKLKIINRMSLVFSLVAISLLLGSSNWQGYRDLYLTFFTASILSGLAAAVISFGKVVGARLQMPAKPHKLIREDKQKKQEQQQDKE